MIYDIAETLSNHLPLLTKAAVSLPVAAVLGTALAFRPRRVGTPRRDMEVIHTQVLLGVVGALLMLVIGESLARAFGIVGAAGLIRYRASIKDPKDAGVMLATLGLGLASGVGLYLLAAFAMLFMLMILWIVESRPPKPRIRYRLRIATPEPFKLRPKVEAVLLSHHLPFELRDCKENELDYDTHIPIDQPPEAIASELQKLETESPASFRWKRKKVA
jgi:hypothetical protein